MSHESPHERLKHTRVAAGLEVQLIARRTGLREAVIAAMEEGRWSDLPRGLYGRAAVRSYAGVLGLDPEHLLADIEPLLPPLEDPIAGLARVRGLRPHEEKRPTEDKHPQPVKPPAQAAGDSRKLGRLLLATTIDAACIGVTVLVLPVATTLLTSVTPSALRPAAVPFGAMAALFTCAYYLVFAGIGGQTPGERIAHATRGGAAPPARCTMRGARTRALESASADARAITFLGAALAAFVVRHTSGGHHDDESVDGQRLAILIGAPLISRRFRPDCRHPPDVDRLLYGHALPALRHPGGASRMRRRSRVLRVRAMPPCVGHSDHASVGGG